MIHHFAYLIAFYLPVNCRWAKLDDTTDLIKIIPLNFSMKYVQRAMAIR